MKYLRKTQINSVHPSFQKAVWAAWSRGEKVPYGIINLTSNKLDEKNEALVEKFILENDL